MYIWLTSSQTVWCKKWIYIGPNASFCWNCLVRWATFNNLLASGCLLCLITSRYFIQPSFPPPSEPVWHFVLHDSVNEGAPEAWKASVEVPVPTPYTRHNISEYSTRCCWRVRYITEWHCRETKLTSEQVVLRASVSMETKHWEKWTDLKNS